MSAFGFKTPNMSEQLSKVSLDGLQNNKTPANNQNTFWLLLNSAGSYRTV